MKLYFPNIQMESFKGCKDALISVGSIKADKMIEVLALWKANLKVKNEKYLLDQSYQIIGTKGANRIAKDFKDLSSSVSCAFAIQRVEHEYIILETLLEIHGKKHGLQLFLDRIKTERENAKKVVEKFEGVAEFLQEL